MSIQDGTYRCPKCGGEFFLELLCLDAERPGARAPDVPPVFQCLQCKSAVALKVQGAARVFVPVQQTL